jgi:cell fate regulator YaaT (PSP1 superfamily)
VSKYLATYGKPRFLGIVSLDEDIYASVFEGGGLMVTNTHRGEELSTVMGSLDEGQEREYRNLRTISEHGEGPLRGGDPVVTDLDFLRVPSDDDVSRREAQARTEDEVLRTARELVEWHRLQIKLIDAESILDGKKLFFYFTADARVDFRTLVKDLARKFRTRIELRQMGVRDEARIIRGLASCGMPCCCSYWLNQFAPIGIKMVKEQNIALNPAKISGICGRLMCCMSFEHKVYRDLWSGLPGPGSKIKTPEGNYIVLSMDVANEAVRCHKPSGGDVMVPIASFDEFKQTVMGGNQWGPREEGEFSERGALNASQHRSCGSCRVNFGFASDGGCASESLKPAGTAERHAPRVSKTASGQKSPAGGDAASERKRQNRRRGHRGGRRHRADASAPAAMSAPGGNGDASQANARQALRGGPPQASAASMDEAGDRAKSASGRCRRRRPRRAPAGTERAD